jgi:hypothetical protein
MPNSNREIVGYEGEIQTNLIEFYNAIHSSQQMTRADVYSITENIRGYLSRITGNKKWLSTTFDPAEFLTQISGIFENVNNCNINSNLLPFIRVSDLNINAYGKNVTCNMFGDRKSCDFIHNGLIVQYGDGRDAILEEKYYLIGKYKLYAFLHWVGASHYSCYFEFNNKWYFFDDLNDYIREVPTLKRKIIYNESFLFFYKFDESISRDINVTLTDYFASDDRTLSIIDDDESHGQSFRSIITQSQRSAVSTADLPERGDSFPARNNQKNWLQVFNICNDTEKDKKAQKTKAETEELESKLKEFNAKKGGTKRKQIIKCKLSKKNKIYIKRKKSRKDNKIKKHKKSRKM